jgi:hypothetical protein
MKSIWQVAKRDFISNRKENWATKREEMVPSDLDGSFKLP